MGKLTIGSKLPKKISYGSTSVKKIYYGATLIWTSEVSFELRETQIVQSQLSRFVTEVGSYKFVKVKVVSGVKYYDIYYADGSANTTGYTQWAIMEGNSYITQVDFGYINNIIEGYDPHAIIYLGMNEYAGEFYYDTTYPTWTENTAYAEAPLEAIDDIVYGLIGNSFMFEWIASGYGYNAAKVYQPTDPKDPPYKSVLNNEWYLLRTPILVNYQDFIEGNTTISSVLPNAVEDFIVIHEGGSAQIKVFIMI